MSSERRMAPGRPSESFPPLVRRMPVEQWPAPDRLAWEEACRPSSLFTVAGSASRLAPITRSKRAGEWGRYLSYLRELGQLDPSEPTAQRLTSDRLAGYIGSLRKRLRDISVWHQINDLSYFVPLIAPGQDWSWIRRHPAMPTLRAVRVSRKPISPPNPAVVFFRALQYCRQAEADPLSITNAVRFRDGLIIAFAVWSVLRRKNLAEIEIGEHFRINGEVMRIVFDRSVKNGEVIDSPVPESLLPYLESYLRRYRPLLLKGAVGSTSLWINAYGTSLAYTAFLHLFHRMGNRLIGRPISVHSVRFAYATSELNLDPRNAQIVSAGLAHRSTASVNRFYDQSAISGVNKAWLKVLGARRRFG
jgi:integrase/recombinase XerD